jgi:hypothetical protein
LYEQDYACVFEKARRSEQREMVTREKGNTRVNAFLEEAIDS